jgi:hypothetical protein
MNDVFKRGEAWPGPSSEPSVVTDELARMVNNPRGHFGRNYVDVLFF